MVQGRILKPKTYFFFQNLLEKWNENIAFEQANLWMPQKNHAGINHNYDIKS